MGRRVDGGIGKPGIAQSLDGGGTVEWIESGETPDKGFGVIKNRVSVRTLEFDFGIRVLLGEGRRVVRAKRGVAAKEHVGDGGYCKQDESGGTRREK